MTVANYRDYNQDFSALCDIAICNSEPVFIKRDDSENVVLITESEFNSIMETLYLMRSPANSKHLMDAMQDENAITLSYDDIKNHNY